MKKGRKLKLVSHLAKLTPTDVRRIRKLHTKGTGQNALAVLFKVSQRTINQLVNRRTYRNVA